MVRLAHQAHPHASTAGDGLDEQRKPDHGGGGARLRESRKNRRTFGHRHAGASGCLPGGGLVPHAAHRLGRGADKNKAAFGATRGKVGVLGQEPVAGMDRLGAHDPGGFQNPLLAEIAVPRGGPPHLDRLVGKPGHAVRCDPLPNER